MERRKHFYGIPRKQEEKVDKKDENELELKSEWSDKVQLKYCTDSVGERGFIFVIFLSLTNLLMISH